MRNSFLGPILPIVQPIRLPDNLDHACVQIRLDPVQEAMSLLRRPEPRKKAGIDRGELSETCAARLVHWSRWTSTRTLLSVTAQV